ncbi:MAG: DUF3558 domain-containing protein [Actinobacteria bacterium]|nr:DUF3558 domain-containing protein [Actinomycetota bacterium]
MRKLAPIGAVLLLAGCTGEAPEEPARQAESRLDPAKPCELLTPEQVEAAISTDVEREREVESHDPGTRICSYDTTQPWTSVGISLEDKISSEDFDDEMRRDPINTEPVDDIGDGAFIHGCSSITVYAANVVATASVQHLTTCEETSVVLQALGRALAETLRPASTT